MTPDTKEKINELLHLIQRHAFQGAHDPRFANDQCWCIAELVQETIDLMREPANGQAK